MDYVLFIFYFTIHILDCLSLFVKSFVAKGDIK